MQNNNQSTQRGTYRRLAALGLGALCLAFAAPLGAYAYMGRFMRIIGDDYCYAAVLRQFGFWMTQWQSYVAIGGYNGNRYALNLSSALADLLGPMANAALPGLALAAWLSGLAWAWHSAARLLRRRALPLSGLLAAEALVFFTLWQAPDLDQSLYWRTGMLTYLAPLITGAWLLGLILWQTGRPRSSLALLAATFLFALLSAGFSEVGAVAHISGLGCLLVWAAYRLWRREGAAAARLLAPAGCALAGSLAALILLAFSPSTHLRLQTLSPPAPLLTAIQIALYSARIFIISITIKHLALPNLLLFALALSGGALQAALSLREGTPTSKISGLQWLLALAGIGTACLLVVVACMLPNAYVQSNYPELRALIIPRFVLVVAAAAAGWLTGRFACLKIVSTRVQAGPSPALRLVSLLAAVVLAISALPPLINPDPILSRAPLFNKWASLWDQRDLQIRVAARYNQGTVQVMELDHLIPRVGELQVGSWYTQCASQYYGIQIVPDLPGWDSP